MSSAIAPIKVSPDTDRKISDAAHLLQRSKKQIVDDAVSEFVENHRQQLSAAALDMLKSLDGTVAGSVGLLTGMSHEKLDGLGGFEN